MRFNTRPGDFSRLRTIEEAFDRALGDARADVLAIADSVFRATGKTYFATEGGSGAKPWAQLSPKYRRWKSKRYPGRKILVREGRLLDAVTTQGPNHVAELVKVGGNRWRLTLGAVGPAWWDAHVTGTDHMPARDPIPRSEAQIATYREAVRRALVPHVMRRMRILGAAGRL